MSMMIISPLSHVKFYIVIPHYIANMMLNMPMKMLLMIMIMRMSMPFLMIMRMTLPLRMMVMMMRMIKASVPLSMGKIAIVE